MTSAIENVSKDQVLLAAKYQMEYYFCQSQFHKDDHLKNLQGPEGWILLSEVWNFRKMKLFWRRLTLEDIAEVMKLSVDVEVKPEPTVWPDGTKSITHFIRKKSH